MAQIAVSLNFNQIQRRLKKAVAKRYFAKVSYWQSVGKIED